MLTAGTFWWKKSIVRSSYPVLASEIHRENMTSYACSEACLFFANMLSAMDSTQHFSIACTNRVWMQPIINAVWKASEGSRQRHKIDILSRVWLVNCLSSCNSSQILARPEQWISPDFPHRISDIRIGSANISYPGSLVRVCCMPDLIRDQKVVENIPRTAPLSASMRFQCVRKFTVWAWTML